MQPVLWLLVFGQVFTRTRAIPTGDLSYIEFMAPGILAQSVLFTAIFYGIAVIWERDLGIVHKLLVSPAPRASLVLGKALAAGIRGLAAGRHHLHPRGAPRSPPRSATRAPSWAWRASSCSASAIFATFSLVVACLVKTRERFMGIGQLLTMPLFFASNAIYPLDLMPGGCASSRGSIRSPTWSTASAPHDPRRESIVPGIARAAQCRCRSNQTSTPADLSASAMRCAASRVLGGIAEEYRLGSVRHIDSREIWDAESISLDFDIDRAAHLPMQNEAKIRPSRSIGDTGAGDFAERPLRGRSSSATSSPARARELRARPPRGGARAAASASRCRRRADTGAAVLRRW